MPGVETGGSRDGEGDTGNAFVGDGEAALDGVIAGVLIGEDAGEFTGDATGELVGTGCVVGRAGAT